MISFPCWKTVKESLDSAILGYGENLRNVINCDQFFDEHGLMKDFCQQKIPVWFQQKSQCVQIWLVIFKNFKDQNVSLINMEKLVEFAFAMPGRSKKVERIFPLSPTFGAAKKAACI